MKTWVSIWRVLNGPKQFRRFQTLVIMKRSHRNSRFVSLCNMKNKWLKVILGGFDVAKVTFYLSEMMKSR